MSPDRVIVHGAATRDVAPDVARLRTVVLEVDDDRREAFKRCGERVAAVVPGLRAAVGTGGEVTTGEVTLDLHYYEEPAERRPRRYAASCEVTVACAPARAADVIAAAVAAGVNELTGPRYSLRDRAPIIDELLGEAIEAARRKGQRLAQAAGRALGAVLEVEEAGHHRVESLRMGDEDTIIETSAAHGGFDGHMDLQPARVRVDVAVRVSIALT